MWICAHSATRSLVWLGADVKWEGQKSLEEDVLPGTAEEVQFSCWHTSTLYRSTLFYILLHITTESVLTTSTTVWYVMTWTDCSVFSGLLKSSPSRTCSLLSQQESRKIIADHLNPGHYMTSQMRVFTSVGCIFVILL